MLKRYPLPTPLLLPLLAWLSGIILAVHLPGISLLYLLIAAAVLTAAGLALKRGKLILIFAILILLGYSRTKLAEPQPSLLEVVLGEKQEIQQEIDFVVKRLISTEAASYEVKLLKVAGIPQTDRLLFYASSELQSGNHYRTTAELVLPQTDPVLDIYPRRYTALAFPKERTTLLYDGSKGAGIGALREKLLANLDENLGEENGLAKALMLSDLSSKKQYRERLTRGGLIHLVVVSGLHVWFIYGFLMVLLGLVLPRRLSYLVFIGIIGVFAALNNWSPPVLRASLMIALIAGAKLLSRPVSPLQILAASLWIITLINPLQLFSVSLILSYSSVGIISMGLPRIQIDSPKYSFLVHLAGRGLHYVLLSLIVGLGILPVTLYYFGSGSLNGVIGNLVGVPLIGLILPLAFLLMLLPSNWYIASIFAASYRFLAGLFIQWADWVASLPLWWQNFYISIWEALAALIGVVVILLLLRGRWRALVWGSLPAALVIFLLLWLPGRFRSFEPGVWFFSGGNADCALIRCVDDTRLMIDTGGLLGSYNESEKLSLQQLLKDNWLQRKLLPFFGREGIRKLDYLVITHMHNDHYGGIASLLQAVRVDKIIISQFTAQHPEWQELVQEPLFRHSEIVVITDTLSIAAGDLKLKFLHPDAAYGDRNENNRSLVLRVEHGNMSLLFTGDIEIGAESYLLQQYPDLLDVDILKVPHHGSRTSSSAAFVEAVSPQVAIFSVARRNRFRFPHPEVQTRYEKAGAGLRFTHEGSIHISFTK